MKRSKIIFIVFAVLFLMVMAYIGYDISSRTTFPGSKPQLKERIINGDKDNDFKDRDSLIQDTTKEKELIDRQ